MESPTYDGAPAHATGAPTPSTKFEAKYRRPWCARTKHKVRPHQAQGAPAPTTGAPAPSIEDFYLAVEESGAPTAPYGAPAPCILERKSRSLNYSLVLVLGVTLYSSFYTIFYRVLY